MCKGKKTIYCPILYNYLYEKNDGIRLGRFRDINVLGGITDHVFLRRYSSSRMCKVPYVKFEYKVREKEYVLFTTQELTIYEK